MAIKRTVTKEEHGKLTADIKAQYIEDGEGFRLDLEMDSETDTGALKRAKDREVELRKKAEARAKELESTLEEMTGADAHKRGDIEALQKSWKEKSDKAAEAANAQINKLKKATEKTLVDNVALAIASKISSAPSLILPHLRSRLQADFESDEPVTRVLDSKGQISALTLEELTAEFVANKDFAAIITASKATGGAGSSTTQNSSANNDVKKQDLTKMQPSDLKARIDARKQK